MRALGDERGGDQREQRRELEIDAVRTEGDPVVVAERLARGAGGVGGAWPEQSIELVIDDVQAEDVERVVARPRLLGLVGPAIQRAQRLVRRDPPLVAAQHRLVLDDRVAGVPGVGLEVEVGEPLAALEVVGIEAERDLERGHRVLAALEREAQLGELVPQPQPLAAAALVAADVLEPAVVELHHGLAVVAGGDQRLELVGGAEQQRVVVDRVAEQLCGLVAAIELVARDHRGEVAVARTDLGVALGVDQPLHEVEAVAPVALVGDQPEELGEQQVIAWAVRERLAVHLARGRAIAELGVAIAERREPRALLLGRRQVGERELVGELGLGVMHGELGAELQRGAVIGRQRQGHGGVAGCALGVAELLRAARDAVVQLDRDLGLQQVLVIVEQALDQLAGAPPVAGVEPQVGQLAAGRRVVRIELDCAGQRVARGRCVAELDREVRALQEVAAQPAGLLRGVAQLVDDRREVRQVAGVPAQLDQREAGLGVVRIGGARVAVQLLGALGVAERDAEVGGVGAPARALRGQRRARGGVDQERDHTRELAAVAQQGREAVDRRRQVGIVGARALVQRLRLVPVVVPRDVGGADQHRGAPCRLRDQPAQPLEREQRGALGVAGAKLEPGQRVDHVDVIGLEPVGLAVGVERAGIVAELAVVDQTELAIQLGAVALADVQRAAAEQLDQHRPLALAAIEQLERLVGLGVGGRDRQHALEAVGGAIAQPQLLPRPRDLGEPARRGVVGRIELRGQRVERQVGPALGDAGQPQQRIDVVRHRRLGERRQPDDQRALGVAALLEAARQLAQDPGALGAVLAGLDPRQVLIDEAMALGVERRVRHLRRRALHRRPHPPRVELGELVDERPDEHLDRAETRGVGPHAGITPQATARRYGSAVLVVSGPGSRALYEPCAAAASFAARRGSGIDEDPEHHSMIKCASRALGRR